jgi:hypothetical protein
LEAINMIRKSHPTILVCALLLLACPKSNIDVGTLTPGTGGNSGAGTGGAPASGGVPAGSGGAVEVGEAGTAGNLGAACDVLTPYQDNQAVYNSAALECPSHVCLKPALAPGLPSTTTAAYCTAACSTDDDCAGTVRNPSSPNDMGCISGFTCGIPFVKGRMCCKKMCVCKDFTGGNMQVPIACQNGGAETCYQEEPDPSAGGTGGSGGNPEPDASPSPADTAGRPNVGAACDLGVPVGAGQAAFSTAAPECSSGVCLKPAVAVGLTDVGTTPLCTAECTADSDCAGALRNPSDPNDKGCVSGFTCATPFVKGTLCCRKMCVCKDFTGGPMDVPLACQNGGGLTCN